MRVTPKEAAPARANVPAMQGSARARPRRRGWRRIAPAWILGTLAVLLALTLNDTLQGDRVANEDGLGRMRTLLFDTYQRIRPRRWAGSPVVVVDIDEASLERIGQWPWPRDELGRMTERLLDAGAAAVVFDMVFAEADRTSPQAAISRLERAGATVSFADTPDDATLDNDAAFARVLERGGVVTGLAFSAGGRRAPPQPKSGLATVGTGPQAFMEPWATATRNLDRFDARASGIGVINHQPGADGVVRRVPLVFVTTDGAVHPSLSIEALRVAQGASNIWTRASDGSGEVGAGTGGTARDKRLTAVRVGDFEVPVNAAGEMRVYHSPRGEKPVVPAYEVVAMEPDRLRERLGGGIVLVGTSAQGLLDLRATPLDPATPGVTIHADIVDQIVSGTFITRPDWAPGVEMLAAFVLGLLAVLVIPFWTSLAHALWALLLAVGAVGFSWYAFREHGLLVGPLTAILAIALGYVTATLVRLVVSERDERFVRSAFGLYLAPALVEELAQDPDQLKLGGEEREVTVLFCDIRGFTTLSEGLGPAELTKLLNDFLTPMTRALMARGATIDKYMGDAIMCFWNAPILQPDHRARACRGVLDMARELEALNARRERPIDIGVGLNTGLACVGNLGSEQRFNYSAIGDCVNVSSRVEGLTKQYGLFNLVTAEAIEGVEDIVSIEVDRVGVVGRTAPLVIHTLLAGEDLTPEFPDFEAAHETFLQAYREGDLDTAREARERAEATAPPALEKLYRLYAARLATLIQKGLPEDWDGVFRATEK